jgi:hypothetical protein
MKPILLVPILLLAACGDALEENVEMESSPAPPVIDTSECLFGTTYSDLRAARTDLQITSSEELHLGAPLGALAEAQLVLAVQQSSHDDVATAAEAFAAVDEQEINRVLVVELASGHSFVAYEYGVGDNSYGAIFLAGSTDLVASIHDGDLYGCDLLATDVNQPSAVFQHNAEW